MVRYGMNTASVSLSPIVVAVSVAENQVQHRISTKVLTDQTKIKAKKELKTVTRIKSSAKSAGTDSKEEHSIDFRA